jgi:hypothetical protein
MLPMSGVVGCARGGVVEGPNESVTDGGGVIAMVLKELVRDCWSHSQSVGSRMAALRAG